MNLVKLSLYDKETTRRPLFLFAPSVDFALGHHSIYSTQLGGAVPGNTVDFWWGAQVGAEWRQADVLQTGQWDNDKRVFALVQPNIGVDFTTAFGRSVVGIGFYAGVPLSLASNESSLGGLLGVRGLLGVN